MLERLFTGAPDGLVEFAARTSNNEWQRRYFPPDQVQDVADKLEGKVDTYFGPALRRSPSPKKDAVGKARVGWVDYDGPSYSSFIPPSYVTVTQHGYHLYYLLDDWYDPDTIEQVNKTLIEMIGGDVDEGCWNANRVLRIPGSVHAEGRVIQLVKQGGYEYNPRELHGLAGLEGKWQHKILTADGRGYRSRSERDFAVVSALLQNRATPQTVQAIFDEQPIGDKYREEAERGNAKHYLETTISNVIATGADKTATKKSKAQLVLDLAVEEGVEVLQDRRGTPYALIERKGHRELLPVDSSRFSDYLAYLLYEKHQDTVSRPTLLNAVRVFRSKALFEGDTVRLDNRVSRRNGAIWYDLTDDQWRAVKVTREGWQVVYDPPMMFRRFIHQTPQVEPSQLTWNKTLNVLWRIFEFINIRDADSRLLFTVYLVSTLVPDIAHPIITLHGEQGTGKSFTLRIIRQLIDPSAVSTLSVPEDPAEFVQQLDHHWCAYYDNVSSMSNWQQDTVCRAVTGEGHTKRKLYSDDEDIIYVYRRCVGLNGITITSSRPDVLDRSLMFELQRLEGYREQEKILLGKFHALKPKLLGAALNILSQAMSIPEDHKVQEALDFRLADWAAWGYRIARAMGEGRRFLELYGTAVKEKSQEALRLHPLGQAVQVFMSTREEWSGFASALLDELDAVAAQQGIDRTQTEWPGGANWLGRRLREVQPDLRKMGIMIDTKEVAQGTAYKITNTGEVEERHKTEISIGDNLVINL